jgi:hypothetical protein
MACVAFERERRHHLPAGCRPWRGRSHPHPGMFSKAPLPDFFRMGSLGGLRSNPHDILSPRAYPCNLIQNHLVRCGLERPRKRFDLIDPKHI